MDKTKPIDLEKLEIEQRSNTESRATVDERNVTGYAVVYNSASVYLPPGFREYIRPGAFAKSLDGDVRALWNHEDGSVLGRTSAGTLKITDDEKGLLTTISLPNSPLGDNALEAIRRGDVSGMSFRFQAVEDEWKVVNGELERSLTDARLIEISPVTFPAYPATTISLRAARYAEEMRATISAEIRIGRLVARMRAGGELTEDEKREMIAIARQIEERYTDDDARQTRQLLVRMQTLGG